MNEKEDSSFVQSHSEEDIQLQIGAGSRSLVFTALRNVTKIFLVSSNQEGNFALASYN